MGTGKEDSALELIELVRLAIPLVGIGRRFPALGDYRPDLDHLGIQRDESALNIRHVILGKDGLSRTLGHAKGAINALLRVNCQKIGAFVKAIDGTDIDAIGIFALDTVLGNDVSHFALLMVTGTKTIAHLLRRRG